MSTIMRASRIRKLAPLTPIASTNIKPGNPALLYEPPASTNTQLTSPASAMSKRNSAESTNFPSCAPLILTPHLKTTY